MNQSFYMIICTLFTVFFCISYAQEQQQSNTYPIELILIPPTSKNDHNRVTYTMWTPNNWTTNHDMTTKLNSTINLPKNPIPILRYNAYVVTIHDSDALEVIVPSLSSKNTNTKTDTTFSKQSSSFTPMDADTTNHVKTPFQTNIYRIGTTPSEGVSTRQKLVRTRNYTSFQNINNTNDKNNNNGNIFTSKLQRTTQQSQNHHCFYAMNGGPFHNDGSMVGIVIVTKNNINGTSDRMIVSDDYGPNIGFGYAQPSQYRHRDAPTTNNNNNKYWVIGSIHNETQIHTLGIQYFITGFDWLVYNGTNVVHDDDDDMTGAYRASRSSIGITNNGTVIFVVVDGCEHCLSKKGVTLHELADILLYLNVQYAVNMDGGSSSTLVSNHIHNEYRTTTSKHQNTTTTIVNHPTCIYNAIIGRWYQCERPVSSVFCIH